MRCHHGAWLAVIVAALAVADVSAQVVAWNTSAPVTASGQNWNSHYLYNSVNSSIVVVSFLNSYGPMRATSCSLKSLTCGLASPILTSINSVNDDYEAFTAAIQPGTDRMFVSAASLTYPTRFNIGRCNATTLTCQTEVQLVAGGLSDVCAPVLTIDTFSPVQQVLWTYFNTAGGIYVVRAPLIFTAIEQVTMLVIPPMSALFATNMVIGALIVPPSSGKSFSDVMVLTRPESLGRGPAIYRCDAGSLQTCESIIFGPLVGRIANSPFVAAPLFTLDTTHARIIVSFVEGDGPNQLLAGVCNIALSECILRTIVPNGGMGGDTTSAAHHMVSLDEAADAAYVTYVSASQQPSAVFCTGDLSVCTSVLTLPVPLAGNFNVLRGFFANGMLFAGTTCVGCSSVGPILWSHAPTPPVRIAFEPGWVSPSSADAGATFVVPLVAYAASGVRVVATGLTFTAVQVDASGRGEPVALNVTALTTLPVEVSFVLFTVANTHVCYNITTSSVSGLSFARLSVCVTTRAGRVAAIAFAHEPSLTPSSGLLGDDVIVGVAQVWRALPLDAFDNLALLATQPTAQLVSSSGAMVPATVNQVGSSEFSVSATIPEPGQYSLEVVTSTGLTEVLLVSVLLDCARGSFAPLRTDSQCIPCSNGTYADEPNLAACLVCPTSTSSPNGAPSLANCTCVAGTWAPNAATPNSCAPCPTGGACAGGGATPTALRGYYPAGNVFERCTRPDACVGGGLCARGYEGFLCNRCSKGFYSEGPGRKCARCPNAPLGLLGVAISVCFAIAVAGYAGVLLRRRAFDAAPPEMRHPRSIVPFAFPSFLLYAQILAMLDLERFSWPSAVRVVLSGVGVFGLSADLLPTQCSVASQYVKYVVHMLLPVLVAVLVIAIVLAVQLARRLAPNALAVVPEMRPRAAVEQTLLSLALLLYMPIARLSLSMFSCVELADGRWYLSVDPGERCFVPAWNAVAPAGGVAVLLYVIGIPGAVAIALFVHRRSLYSDRAVLARYGALFQRYWSSYWWFELAVLGRRLSIVLVASFALSSPVLLTGLLLAVFLLMAGVTLRFQPAYLAVHNELESQLNVALSIVLLLGFAFSTSAFQSSGARFFGVVLTLATIGAGGLAILRAAIVEMRGAHEDTRALDTMRAVIARYKDDAQTAALELLVAELAYERGGDGKGFTAPHSMDGRDTMGTVSEIEMSAMIDD